MTRNIKLTVSIDYGTNGRVDVFNRLVSYAEAGNVVNMVNEALSRDNAEVLG